MIYIDRIIAAVCIRADNKNGAEIPSDIDSRRNLLDAIFYLMIYCKKQQAGIVDIYRKARKEQCRKY